MATDTKTLIDVFKHPTSVMKKYHKGRLQGRLDILEDLKIHQLNNYEFEKVSEEIKMIKDALEVDEA